jgi:hypothetical protein
MIEVVFHRAREGGEKDIPKRRDDGDQQAAQSMHREHAWREHTGAGRQRRSSAYDMILDGSNVYQAKDMMI